MPKSSKFPSIIAFLFTFLTETAPAQARFLENGNPLRRGEGMEWNMESPTRRLVDLSGLWSFQTDANESGAVKVPSAYDFAGAVTLQRKFFVSAEDLAKYRFHLVMLGSNYHTDIVINTNFVGSHSGGYTSFIVPIESHYLQPGGENVITVNVDNRLDGSKTIPLRGQVWAWKNYGGILRDVYLLATPPVFLSDVVVRSSLSSDRTVARLNVTAGLEGPIPSRGDSAASQFQFAAEVYDKQSGVLVATSAPTPVTHGDKTWNPATTELTVTAPRLWSPETPDLYDVKAILLDAASLSKRDELTVTSGIREIRLADGRIHLNGKKIQLKGLIWIEDHPQFGGAMSYEAMEKDMVAMHKTGANAIRFGHHPPHPYMLSLCDRYGKLALVELPVARVPASILVAEHYVELGGILLREMIRRDRNHPSVLAWGIGDEFESRSADARVFVQTLANEARLLDNRPLYYATRTLNDACSDLMDINAITLTTYDIKEFKATFDKLRAASSAKPFIIIKMGTEVQHGNSNGYADPLSQQAQARYFFQHYDVVQKANTDGAFAWSFNDWRGDRPALTVNSGDPWMHTMGIMSYDRQKRTAYEIVRSVFTEEKHSALLMGSTSSSAPIVYVLSGLVLLVGTAYLYNANRRFRDSLNRSMVNAYNFFADIRDQRVVTILHSTIVGLVVSAAGAIVVSSLLYHFRGSVALDNLLSMLLVSDGLKEDVVRLIRNPQLFVLVFTGVFFALALVACGALLLFAPLFKARLSLYHAYATTMWSITPLLILVPISMILYRLIESEAYVIPAVVVVLALLIWVLARLLKGVAIIVDSSPAKVYFVGALSLVVLFGGMYIYLDQTQSASDYARFLYHEFANRGH